MQGLAMPRVLMGLDLRHQMRILEKRIPTLATSAAELEEFLATGCLASSY
jgi:hypothetical protein